MLAFLTYDGILLRCRTSIWTDLGVLEADECSSRMGINVHTSILFI